MRESAWYSPHAFRVKNMTHHKGNVKFSKANYGRKGI